MWWSLKNLDFPALVLNNKKTVLRLLMQPTTKRIINHKDFLYIKKVHVRECPEDLNLFWKYPKFIKKQHEIISEKWKASFEVSWTVVEVL